MIRSFDALVSVLGDPAVDLDSAVVQTLRRPMVYVWIRRHGDGQELIEYVGKSTEGIARPLSGYHHRRNELGYGGDRLLCWCVESDEAATALEQDLITRCNPRLNARRPRLNVRKISREWQRSRAADA